MTTYAVHAQILTHADGYHGSRSVPTFYLDSRVQGIISREHAVSVAAGIVNPLGLIPACDLQVSAVPVDPARESADLDYAALQREHAAMGAGHDAWCAGPMAHTSS